MLFPDLSAPTPQVNKKSHHNAIAFVLDRFIALALDFLILSPVISLLLAGLVRKAKTSFLLDATSPGGLLMGILVFILGACLVVLLQSVFLFFWQATPGQLFMQMRVVSYPNWRARLSFSQCFLRSLCFVLNFLLMGLPFMEILSHPLRRAFHERASDTMVITLKSVGDSGPAEIEQRFVNSWLRMGFLFLALFAVTLGMKSYHAMYEEAFHSASNATGPHCKEFAAHEWQEGKRLDAAISLFMLNEISDDCLNIEADASLWGDPVNSQDLAYLAKYLITEKEEQTQYFKKICKDRTSSSCLIATYLKDNKKSVLKDADQKLWTTQILNIEEQYEAGEIVSSLESIEKLQKIPALSSALEKKYVRSIWALHENTGRKSGRAPASANKENFLNTFKEKYGIQ